MKPIDIVIIVLAVVAVVGITAWTVWKKKTGKGGGCCDCDCKGYCGGCPSARKKSDSSDE